MSEFIIIDAEGERHTLEAKEGESVMAAAVNHDIPGIIGECRGELSCGTCHVYVAAEWLDRIEGPKGDEEDMLDVVDDRRENSRLSCQIFTSAATSGLVVTAARNDG